MENLYDNNKNISTWLFICCIMIFSMVIIGGLTRLTDSGLSMTNWKPITGILPPITEHQWNIEFDSYRQSPEYKHINNGMNLSEFKNIFWLEYIHRVFGRLTGLIFFIPLVYFIFKKQLSKRNITNLSIIFLLGAAQGIVGWLMVKSGLQDRPHVSPYWLSFHLTNAFIIFALVFILALNNIPNISKYKTSVPKTFRIICRTTLFLTFLQIILGGFVAGNHAGLTYNTYPLMDGQIIPNGLFIHSSILYNLFENITTVQFNHRLLAHILVVLYITLFFQSFKINLTKPISYGIRLNIGIFLLQFIVGILTLIFVVPTALASIHQSIAFILFATIIFVNYMVSKNNG